MEMNGRLQLKNIVNQLQSLLKFLVFSNVYLSACASIATFAVMYFLEVEPVPLLLFVPFASALFIYNFNRFSDIEEDSINVPERLEFSLKFGKPILYTSAILYLLSLVLLFLKNFHAFLVVVSLPALGILYSALRLKRILFAKNLIVSTVWGGAYCSLHHTTAFSI